MLERAGATLGAEDVVAGPQAIGQRVTRTVRFVSRTVTLAGRAVDERGAPLRALELEASLERGRIAVRLAALTTDGDGRFALDLPTELGEPRPHALVLARRLDSGEELASGRAPLPRELTAGRHELGDLRLAPSPVLASGVVVDARGAPVPGAEVRRYFGENSRKDPTRLVWRGLAPQFADARGRFVVRGEEERATLALSAERDGAVSERIEVPVGARDVVLRLQ